MSSKYLDSLTTEERNQLISKLHRIQNGTCYICGGEIDLTLHVPNIDHIIPLANRGKDQEDNFALTHESCNKSKQDSNLKIARILHLLQKIQDKTENQENRAASLKQVLEYFGGSKYDIKHKTEENKLKLSFSEIGNNNIITSQIFEDALSKEKTCFLEIPIEYIFHDELINPRGINSSISRLIKEFEKGNPQLHLSLARINDNKIKIFDGQHKAVAQIL